MKKLICFNMILGAFMIMHPALCQSNDEKAVDFLDNHLKTMFKVLNTKPQTISPTCMDSLKKLHDFKETLKQNTELSDTQKEVNASILRALYSNSIQFCETDVQAICSKRAEPTIRNICKEILSQND